MKSKLLFLIFTVTATECFSQNIRCTLDEMKRSQITVESNPNSYTCFMELKRGWSTYYGTGALIHPRVIITAGHNIAYFPFTKRFPFVLFRGTRSVNLYFGSINATTQKVVKQSVKLKTGRTKFFNKGYWINSDISKDFSIIILPDLEVYNAVKGYYKFTPLSKLDIENKEIQIIGSPGDKDLFEMWTSKTNNFRLEDNGLKYDLYTEKRNSGSPIWFIKDSYFQLVGVHSRGFGNCNAAVFIDQENYAKVVEWCNSIGIDLAQ